MNYSRVLYLDNHLLIYNKEPGEIVQGDKTGDEPLSEHLKNYLKEKYKKPGNVFLGVVHRLDRPVSGALLFARTSKSLSRLNLMFQRGEISKTYWAVVQHLPQQTEATLVHYLVRNEKQNKTYVREQRSGRSQKAELNYKVVARSDRYILLEIKLLTGRHHQIRAQLAHIGSPIKVDLKYGFARSNPDGSIHLHSLSVEFVHPVKKIPVRVNAPLPADPVWDFFGSCQPVVEPSRQ